MAISDRIKAEAKRTIDGIQRYYENYADDTDDAEEMEHRIARVEAAMEGCNGLSHDDKIQKTAENLFELTCAQERTFDSIRREMRIMRDESKQDFEAVRSDYDEKSEALRKELRVGLDKVAKRIEDSGMDCSSTIRRDPKGMGVLINVIAQHPLMAFNTFIFILILAFVSGHFDAIAKLLGAAN